MGNKISIDINSGSFEGKTKPELQINLKNLVPAEPKNKTVDETSENINFAKHKMPSEQEIEKEDGEEIEEVREEEINESLQEIYQDKNGQMVDVKKLDKKKKKGPFFYAAITAIVLLAAYFGYGYCKEYSHLLKSTNADKAVISVEAPSVLYAGEEFVYTINYANSDRVAFENIEISAVYPQNFIIMESDPASIDAGKAQNGAWRIDKLDPGQSGKIEIKGKIIAPLDTNNTFYVEMSYKPQNYNSQFKKSATHEARITDTGIDLVFDNFSNILVGQESEIKIKYKAKEKKYLDNFRLSLNTLENMQFLASASNTNPGIWTITEIKPEEQLLAIKFKFKEKINPTEELGLKFETEYEGKYYEFFTKTISFEVTKSNLNLNMIINGSRTDQGVDFGQQLNYSLAFANKGENVMKDVILMAVLDSSLIDWKSLNDENKGKIGNKSITWTKNEIPILAELASGQEGVIDFSLNVVGQTELKSGQTYEIKNYAQFNIGSVATSTEESEQKISEQNKDTKSNVIILKINSNVDLDERIMYFNEDNIAVGSGPIPPKIGQTTAYKTNWRLSNSLHELNNLIIETILPEYVKWEDKSNVSVGTIEYNEANRKIIWNIGRLPVSDYKVEADFSISITPSDEYFNKIMVLSNGVSIKAVDTETDTEINKNTKAKTTKLESDEIAQELNSDGRITK